MADLEGLDLIDLARRIAGLRCVLVTEQQALDALNLNGTGAIALASLLDGEWLSVWTADHLPEPMLMLSVRAASALELEACEGRGGVYFWTGRGDSIDPGPPLEQRTRRGIPLETRHDPSQHEPWKILAAMEANPAADARLDAKMQGDEQHMAALAAWRRARSRRVPTPSVIMTGVCAWPPPERSDGLCPVCGGKPLRRSVACGWCLASGVDDLLPEVLPSERPREYVWTEGPIDLLSGGTGPSLGMSEADFDAFMAATMASAEAHRKKRAKEQAEARKAAKAKAAKKAGFGPPSKRRTG